MKTIRRTNMTSTSGVMLISFIRPSSSSPAKGLIAIEVPRQSVRIGGVGRAALRREPKTVRAALGRRQTRTRHEERMQAVREAIQFRDDALIRTRQRVVREHRGN